MIAPIEDDAARNSARILVVEDVDFNLAILTTMLGEQGWQAVAATSGEAALDILTRDTNFQLILMDIGLPGIDGIETTHRIKANPATSAIPVIALTAADPAECERLLTAGLDGYAEKNFDPDQLFSTIKKHLLSFQVTPQKAGHAFTEPQEDSDLDFETLFATYTDENTLCRIARAFFTDTNKALILLSKAMHADDQPGILACCHSLGGSSAIFTAKKLGTAVKELELCIREGKTEASQSIWQKVLAAHDSLLAAVSHRLNLSIQKD